MKHTDVDKSKTPEYVEACGGIKIYAPVPRKSDDKESGRKKSDGKKNYGKR